MTLRAVSVVEGIGDAARVGNYPEVGVWGVMSEQTNRTEGEATRKKGQINSVKTTTLKKRIQRKPDFPKPGAQRGEGESLTKTKNPHSPFVPVPSHLLHPENRRMGNMTAGVRVCASICKIILRILSVSVSPSQPPALCWVVN